MEALQLQRAPLCLPTPEIEEVTTKIEEDSGHPNVIMEDTSA